VWVCVCVCVCVCVRVRVRACACACVHAYAKHTVRVALSQRVRECVRLSCVSICVQRLGVGWLQEREKKDEAPKQCRSLTFASLELLAPSGFFENRLYNTRARRETRESDGCVSTHRASE
jgi:hypothetical protein